jgi:hypothetical protein
MTGDWCAKKNGFSDPIQIFPNQIIQISSIKSIINNPVDLIDLIIISNNHQSNYQWISGL